MAATPPQPPLFPLGQLVATPGALEAMEQAGQPPVELLARHANGDWGQVCDDDKALNDEAVRDGSRILSAYHTKLGVKLWIITEAVGEHGQREATTILLPDEY